MANFSGSSGVWSGRVFIAQGSAFGILAAARRVPPAGGVSSNPPLGQARVVSCARRWSIAPLGTCRDFRASRSASSAMAGRREAACDGSLPPAARQTVVVAGDENRMGGKSQLDGKIRSYHRRAKLVRTGLPVWRRLTGARIVKCPRLRCTSSVKQSVLRRSARRRPRWSGECAGAARRLRRCVGAGVAVGAEL